MSSEIGGGGVIAAAVILPAAAALGAGWLAWQAGKLVVDTAVAVNEDVRRKQLLLQEQEKQRRSAALASHRQLVDMCRGVLGQLNTAGISDVAEVTAMRRELEQLCQGTVPEDTARLESLNALGVMTLDRIVARHQRLQQAQAAGSGEYAGLAVADLMDDLRLAVAAARITETRGTDVAAADPDVLERAELNRRLADVAARITGALEYVVELANHYGMSAANSAWFQSCFNGVDSRIAALCSPRVSNEDLKKGIRSLEELMKMYDMYSPSLKKEQATLEQLYPVYLDAARALGVRAHSLRHFGSASALQEALEMLRERAELAKQRAAIYQALGPADYMCHAWDEELKALGYSVCSRKKITEMAAHKPTHSKIGDWKSPCYQWDADAITQIYEITPQCRLQLIVHPDGSTTMQTISDPVDQEAITRIQQAHCEKMKLLHQRLRDNWFILYDLDELSPAEDIHTLQAWRSSAANPWAQTETPRQIPGTEREREKTDSQHTMHLT